MNKLREDVRVGVLGAAAGLFSISVALMLARVDAYYSYLSWLNSTSYRETYYGGGVENLWWIPVGIWHLILSITASLLVHRHLTTRLRSPFLLWQVIGISSLVGWVVTFLLMFSIDCLMTGRLNPVQPIIIADDAVIIAKFLSAGFACNVVFASVMKASARQYSAQFDELASEVSSADHLLTSS